MPISNITRTNTVDEWRIQTNQSASALNKIETGNYDKTAGSLNIACTAVLSITSTGTGLSVANNALISGDFTVGKSIALGSEGAATGNLTVGANVFIYGKGAALFVANSAIVNVNLQATQSIRTNNFIANNDASITGTAQLGVLTVNTNATVGTTLDVVGNTTVGNLVTSNSVVGDNGRFSSNVVAAHFIAINGSLVANNARISANATFDETTATTINATNARISGNANVSSITASGSLVADNARIAANATFGETTATTINTTNARISGNANVAHVTASGSLVADSARITSNVTASHFVASGSGSVVSDSLRITNDAGINGTLRVTGNSVFGNVNTSNMVYSGTLRTVGRADIGTTLDVTGNTTVGNLVTSNSVVSDSLRITSDAGIGGTLRVTGNSVFGNVNTSNMVYSGTLRTVGRADIGTTLDVTGNTTVGNLVTSNSVVSDSLRITSDAGIGGTLRVTGNSVFGNVNTANMMYAGSLRTVGRADVGGALSVGTDVSIGGQLSVTGNFVLTGDIVYDTDVLSISTVTPVTTTGAGYFGVFRGNTTGGVTGHNGLPNSDANAYIRWIASSNTWQIRDVFNPDVGTSYSKILTANLISSSLTSISTDTFLSSSGAKSLKDSITTEITDRQANVGAGIISANTNLKNYVDVANTNLKNYTDATFLPKTGGTISSDLTISGSLTVSGTVTTINTEEINLADNEIVLNSNHTTNMMPTQNAGIVINRGSIANSPNVFIRYDEANDYWVLRDNVGHFIIATTANVGAGIISANTNLKNYVDVANTNLKNYVDVANTNLKNYVDVANTNLKNYVDVANTNLKNYVDVAVAGKDNTDEITEGSTNKYYTDTRARAAVSAAGSLTYSSSTGVFSYTTPSSSGIAEGTNLYYTDTRARAAVGVAATFGAPLSYISANGAFQHLNSGVTATGYGDSVNVPVFVVNGTGHVTSVTNTAIRAATTSVTGIVQLTDTEGSTSTTTAATPNAVTTANTKMKNYVDAAVAGKDNTDEITEGSTNKYYTDTRARAAVSATGSLSYNSTTGVFSYTQGNTDTVSEGSTNLYFTNTRARAAVGIAATFGTPLNYISANGAFQHLNSGVTATNYGGAATVPVFTVNATGHLSYAGNVAIAISSGAVSGLASSATTDTTNAGNISSGTLAAGRLGTTGAPQFGSLGVGTAASGTTGEIRATGDITAGYTSDKRLKTNIEIIPNALEKVYSLDGVTFNWNELAEGKDTTEREAGVIAQQIQSVLPEAIMTRDTGYLAVRYEKIIPLLIEAIKDLKAEIEELKKK